MKKLVAAVDQGTTSTRCVLVNHEGAIVGGHQLEHQQIYPKPGWVEHDAAEIWERTQAVIRKALSETGTPPDAVAAVGITNQRETTLLWERGTGQPVGNALVWQDTRTEPICRELASEGGQDRFRAKTGLPLATYFSGPKIRWLLDQIDGVRDKAERGDVLFGNIDTWLVWNLTGGPNGGAHVTDVTNASRTQLMNLETLDWDDDILAAMGVPRAMLPSIRPSSGAESFGETSPSGPFGAAIPVSGVLGDQQAALFGQTCFTVGDAKNTYGTGCFLLLNTGPDIVASSSGLVTTVGYQVAGEPAIYALEGSIAIAGALVQWLRDNLELIADASEVEALARSVEDHGGMYLVPAFSGLFAPHWRGDARGVMVGLTRYINRGHIARASLEAVAFQTREVLEAMQADSGVTLSSLNVDGGMVRNELLMQFQADILGKPVVRPAVTETTAIGAAYAAGLAVGFWKSLDELQENWSVDKTWEPAMTEEARDRRYREWNRAVERTLGWIEE